MLFRLAEPSGGTGVGSIPSMLSCDVMLSLPSLVTGAKSFSLEESSSFASSPLSDTFPAWPYLHFCTFGICTLSLSEDETVSIEGGVDSLLIFTVRGRITKHGWTVGPTLRHLDQLKIPIFGFGFGGLETHLLLGFFYEFWFLCWS